MNALLGVVITMIISATYTAPVATATALRYAARAVPQRRISTKITHSGEVAERSKALAWKASVRVTPYRGFESHPLRHYTSLFKHLDKFSL